MSNLEEIHEALTSDECVEQVAVALYAREAAFRRYREPRAFVDQPTVVKRRLRGDARAAIEVIDRHLRGSDA